MGAGDSPQPCFAGKHIRQGLEEIPGGRLDSCQGTSVVGLVSEWSLTRGHKTKSTPDRLHLWAFLMLSGNYHWG